MSVKTFQMTLSLDHGLNKSINTPHTSSIPVYIDLTKCTEDLSRTKRQKKKNQGIHLFSGPVCLLEVGHYSSSALGLGFTSMSFLFLRSSDSHCSYNSSFLGPLTCKDKLWKSSGSIIS